MTIFKQRSQLSHFIKAFLIICYNNNIIWYSNIFLAFVGFYYITRFFMLCEVKGGQFETNEETSEARYFDVDDLPSDLNDHKSSEAQIRLCLDAWRDRSLPPVID